MRIPMVVLAAALAVAPACSRPPPADLAKARSVMHSLLDRERDHRGSHGGYWRDSQPKLDRAATMKGLGIDIAAAEGFEFTVDPPESGYDPKLRVVARGRGAEGEVSLTCVLDAAKPEPACEEKTS